MGEARGDVDRRARALTNLGAVNRGLGDLSRALDLFRGGLAAAEEVGVLEVQSGLFGIALVEADTETPYLQHACSA